MMPFAGEFEDIYVYGIKPAVEESGYVCFRADEMVFPGAIMKQIIDSIFESDILIVDVTHANPNVFYELGIAHAVPKPVIIITRDIKNVPFDLRSFRVLVYDRIRKLQEDLKIAIKEVTTGPVISPVVEARPEIESVPKEEYDRLIREIKDLTLKTEEQERELDSAKQAQGAIPELSVFRREIKEYLGHLTSDLLNNEKEKMVKLQVEIERLKADNESLHSAQREVRRLKQMTLVNPHWSGRNYQIDDDLCFLLMPFSEPWSDDVWKLIDGIVVQYDLRCERADEKDGRVVMDDIWDGINRARIVIADLTSRNPNVTYEVGLADVIGKDLILLSQTPDDVPFDFLGLRLITYENSIGGVSKLSEDLSKRIGRLIR
jgi:hypothetical protein